MIPLISVKRLSKSFPGVRALHEVQFELMAGEVHALMGENGAGKSTLMKILAGVYTRDSGEILYDGQPVEFPSPREAQAMGVCIIHQELQLMNHLTVAQNMFIGREPRGRLGLFLDEDKLNAQARDILARMHVNLDPRAVVGTLTVASQQMVEIAKALSFDSRVLIMDEPTSALNDAEIAELFRIIRELKSRGVGIIYISHKMDELKQIADRVTVLRDGEYVATVAARDTSVEAIIGMMVGRTLTDVAPSWSVAGTGEVALEVKQSERRPAGQRRELRAAQRRDIGLCRLDGRRSHRGRPSGVRRRSDRIGRDYRERREGDDQDSRATQWRAVSAISRKTASASALRPEMDVESNIVMSNLAQIPVAQFFLAPRPDTPDRLPFHQSARHSYALRGAGGAASLGRQSAENRHCEMA